MVKQTVRPGTAKRMLRFAVPYAWFLGLFLFVVILDAAISIANPLIYRDIINNGILKGNGHLIIHLAILVGILGVFDSALGVAQSYLSATVGARVVLSLRTKLFEHIQQMSLAFFTRAQTGALVSRLNADVTGAQSAFTDILSDVVGNMVTVVLVVGAMFVLCWQITLAALILLPLFLLPARFWGTETAGHHARELQPYFRDEQPDDRTFQCRRCAARKALRPPAGRKQGIRGKSGPRVWHWCQAHDLRAPILYRA